MNERLTTISGAAAPRFLYGTAWKESATEPLTAMALAHGFRGVDTANQRRHYDEAAVGRALAAAIASESIARDDLFLQTKFTFRAGQDHRLPYDPHAAIPQQVAQSLASSLAHLGVETIDSYLLHGPSVRAGLASDDWAAWRAMEEHHDAAHTRYLGVSNVSLEQLDELCQGARVQPRIVQNRCFAVTGWDRTVREYCRAHGIVYQGFSLLTANQAVLSHPSVVAIAAAHDFTPSQTIFRFALEVGMTPLTGTTSADHMQQDLQAINGALSESEVEIIEKLMVRQP